MLVHLTSRDALDPYRLSEVRFDESLVESLQVAALPPDWRADPGPAELRRIGDGWVRRRSSAVLRVPSAIVTSEVNFLLNPAHPDFAAIEVAPSRAFRLDARLVRP